jgi:hypothetical protein
MGNAKTGILVGAACVAACAGAGVLPMVLGGAALGAFGGELGVLAVLALGGGVWFWSRRRKAACACPSDGGCQTGDACDLPDLKGRP